MKYEELIYAKSFFFFWFYLEKKNAIIVHKILEDI